MDQQNTVEAVTGMVVSLAARAWRSLPCDVQVWLSIPDLVQIGTRELLKYAKYYDPNRGASWATYAYRLLHDTYVNEIRRYYQPKYRPILPTMPHPVVGGSLFDQYEAFLAVYSAASEELRGWLRRAVGIPVGAEHLPYQPARRYRPVVAREKEIAAEMTSLCARFRFSIEDARELQGDDSGEYLVRQNRNALCTMPQAL